MVVISTQTQLKRQFSVTLTLASMGIVIFTFKCVLLENQKCNYFNLFLFFAPFYFPFTPLSFINFKTLSLSWYFLQKKSRKVLFKDLSSGDDAQWRITMPRDCTSYC